MGRVHVGGGGNGEGSGRGVEVYAGRPYPRQVYAGPILRWCSVVEWVGRSQTENRRRWKFQRHGFPPFPQSTNDHPSSTGCQRLSPACQVAMRSRCALAILSAAILISSAAAVVRATLKNVSCPLRNPPLTPTPPTSEGLRNWMRDVPFL